MSIFSCRRNFSSLLFTSSLFLSFASLVIAKRGDNTIPRPADPFADPKHDPFNPLRYIASNTLTAIFFSLVMIVAIGQSILLWRKGGQFMITMIIACYTFAVGLALRFGLHEKPESKGIYIAEYLFVVLSPCGFIACNYVLLGRMSRWLRKDEHLWISPRRITLVFVTSDIVTFLVQAAGGAISSSDNFVTAQNGSHIFLAGLALQLVSFLLFCILYTRFLWRVRRYETKLWTQDRDLSWWNDWRSLAIALVISCIGILIRSIYRTIELGEGWLGKLATSEGFFYGLDTVPLLIAIAIYLPFWPGRFIPPVDELKETELRMKEREGASASGGSNTPEVPPPV